MGALIGGIVGAAVGVAIHVALATGMFGEPIEASWFAIITGLLTGLGVKQATARGAGVSYARGGMAAVIALAGILATFYAIQMKLTMDGEKVAAKAPERPKADAADDAETDGEAASSEGTVADAADAEETPQPAAAAVAGGKTPVPTDFNPWQFAYMAIGALIAYQFGRGSESSSYPAPQAPAGEAPVAMDPSN
jgi:hypothetical protein